MIFDDRQHAAPSLSDGHAAKGRNRRPTLRGDHSNFGELLANSLASLFTATICHDDFHRWLGLIGERLQAFSERFPTVDGWNNDGNERLIVDCFGHGAWLTLDC